MAEDDKAETLGSPEQSAESFPLVIQRADGTFNIVHNRDEARLALQEIGEDLHAVIEEKKKDPVLGPLFENFEELLEKL